MFLRQFTTLGIHIETWHGIDGTDGMTHSFILILHLDFGTTPTTLGYMADLVTLPTGPAITMVSTTVIIMVTEISEPVAILIEGIILRLEVKKALADTPIQVEATDRIDLPPMENL